MPATPETVGRGEGHYLFQLQPKEVCAAILCDKEGIADPCNLCTAFSPLCLGKALKVWTDHGVLRKWKWWGMSLCDSYENWRRLCSEKQEQGTSASSWLLTLSNVEIMEGHAVSWPMHWGDHQTKRTECRMPNRNHQYEESYIQELLGLLVLVSCRR